MNIRICTQPKSCFIQHAIFTISLNNKLTAMAQQSGVSKCLLLLMLTPAPHSLFQNVCLSICLAFYSAISLFSFPLFSSLLSVSTSLLKKENKKAKKLSSERTLLHSSEQVFNYSYNKCKQKQFQFHRQKGSLTVLHN